MNARIRRLDPTVALPVYQTPGAAGFDLAVSVDTVIPPGEVRLVPTGLVIEVPEGHFLGVFARSSTPLKRGLMVANGVGVVDPDYSGPTDEVKIEVFNFTTAPVTVRKGDRIAQGIVMPATRVEWERSGRDPRDRARRLRRHRRLNQSSRSSVTSPSCTARMRMPQQPSGFLVGVNLPWIQYGCDFGAKRVAAGRWRGAG